MVEKNGNAEEVAEVDDVEVDATEGGDEGKLEIEVVDDTPEEDRGKAPMPKEIVDELESDELGEYTGKVKLRMKQLKKTWHDERRAKDRALREQQEAINYAKKMQEENARLKNTLSSGEKQLLDTYKAAAELEIDSAKRDYKAAYEEGDADKVAAAQQKMASANYKFEQAKAYVPTLQREEPPVDFPQPATQTPQKIDTKTAEWQERNEWWGSNEEMTGTAFGLHQRLLRDKGQGFVGTDEYWNEIDQTMSRRFPEYFGEETQNANANGKTHSASKRTPTRPATVVAPASRSTTSKKVRLTATQINLAKKFGLTPEQYAREQIKLTEMEN